MSKVSNLLKGAKQALAYAKGTKTKGSKTHKVKVPKNRDSNPQNHL